MHTEIDMLGKGREELQLGEAQRELAQLIYQGAKQLVGKFGESSNWGERLPQGKDNP